jgi:hypothetical protein
MEIPHKSPEAEHRATRRVAPVYPLFSELLCHLKPPDGSGSEWGETTCSANLPENRAQAFPGGASQLIDPMPSVAIRTALSPLAAVQKTAHHRQIRPLTLGLPTSVAVNEDLISLDIKK